MSNKTKVTSVEVFCWVRLQQQVNGNRHVRKHLTADELQTEKIHAVLEAAKGSEPENMVRIEIYPPFSPPPDMSRDLLYMDVLIDTQGDEYKQVKNLSKPKTTWRVRYLSEK